MKILNKIFNKSRLPIVLFLIVLINYYPLFMNNFNTTKSVAVTVKQMGIAFAIECILLALFIFNNTKITKETKRNIALLSVVTIITLIIQVKNFFDGKFQIMDLANITCITLNIAMLFICVLSIIKVKQTSIYLFYIGIVLIGILACVVNFIIYSENMLTVFGINSEAQLVSIKSFFAHRNQFAFFLYFSIASTVILFLKSYKIRPKIVLSIIFLFFLFNLITTASRTGLLCTGIFLTLFFITTNKIHKKTKIILVLLAILIAISCWGMIKLRLPNLQEKIIKVLENVFIREKSIKTFTGRSNFWNLAFQTISKNPVNMLFGIGRFVGLELLKENNYRVTQFHSFYVEALVAGGIMELLYFLYIYITVLRKILKSNLRTKYKRFYISLYISFAIYCGFESIARFSIGCVDTMCLIFVITIPLLHANSKLNVKKWKKVGEINK